MRQSEVHSVRYRGMVDRGLPVAGLIVAMLVALTIAWACGGGGSSGGGKWEGAATLVPEGVSEVNVYDVSAILAADLPIGIPEELEALTSIGIPIEDVSSYAVTSLGGAELHVVEGDIDFDGIESLFAEMATAGYAYSSSTYGDHEMHEVGDYTVALLVERNSVVVGDVDATKAVLDALVGESRFLLHGEEPRTVEYSTYVGVAADEYVGMTLDRAHGGFFASVDNTSPTGSRGGGWGSGWSASAGNGSTVEIRIFLSWKTEEAAKSAEDDVRGWFERVVAEGVTLESVERDGIYIDVTATVDEADWDERWTRFTKPY